MHFRDSLDIYNGIVFSSDYHFGYRSRSEWSSILLMNLMSAKPKKKRKK